MTLTENPPGAQPGATDAAEALAGRLFDAGLHGMELGTVALGAGLGLYRVLAGSGPITAAGLARTAGIAGRYATEWLEQQAAAGFLSVDDPGRPADERRYALAPGAEAVFVREESPTFSVPLGDFVMALGQVFGGLLRAYRDGTGVPYADYGIQDAQAAFNRPAFTHLLTTEWIPAVPDVEARLRAGARVAEFGCGEGWAAIALARAFPSATVDGFDVDDASIAAARRHAAEAGLGDRVRFEVEDLTDADIAGDYDLVLAFEMLHDVARPVDVLRTARRLTGLRGPVIVMDEKVAPAFAAPADPWERFLYASSVLHCLPVGMAQQPSAGTGAVMRAETLRRYAIEAGFDRVDILPIESDPWRFYRLEG